MDNIKQLISRRRRQILVHSYLYYEKDSAYIEDASFDKWCKELVELQAKYPVLSKECVYYEEFKEFDGSSGFDLPYNLPEIERKAMQLLSYR